MNYGRIHGTRPPSGSWFAELKPGDPVLMTEEHWPPTMVFPIEATVAARTMTVVGVGMFRFTLAEDGALGRCNGAGQQRWIRPVTPEGLCEVRAGKLWRRLNNLIRVASGVSYTKPRPPALPPTDEERDRALDQIEAFLNGLGSVGRDPF